MLQLTVKSNLSTPKRKLFISHYIVNKIDLFLNNSLFFLFENLFEAENGSICFNCFLGYEKNNTIKLLINDSHTFISN